MRWVEYTGDFVAKTNEVFEVIWQMWVNLASAFWDIDLLPEKSPYKNIRWEKSHPHSYTPI